MVLNFEKITANDVPVLMVVIQHYKTAKVLMAGVMTKQAFDKTRLTGKVTFWSRTEKRLWTKGETIGNFLLVKEILVDCDSDTLLIMAKPTGPVCHTGAMTCFTRSDGIERKWKNG